MKIPQNPGFVALSRAVLTTISFLCLEPAHAEKPASDSASDDAVMFGKFDVSRDIFLAQFDGRPDADDVHAQPARK